MLQIELNKQKLLSVIIPIYNVEAYLPRCLESIINQTYQNLQIICIDDGSTDKSGLIADEYACRDARIHVIHKVNGGHSSARKKGLQVVKGEYTTFVDSDDYIDTKMYEDLMRLIVKYNADIITSNEIRDYGNYVILKDAKFKAGLYEGTKLQAVKENIINIEKFYECNLSGHIWDKIFRTNLIKKNLPNVPEEIIIGEDAIVAYSCIFEAKRLIITENHYYHYCLRHDSITGAKKENCVEAVDVFSDYTFKVFGKYINETKNIMDQTAALVLYCKMLCSLEQTLKYENDFFYPYGKIKKDEKILLYGAGKYGIAIHDFLTRKKWFADITWADKLGQNGAEKVADLNLKQYDKVIIAILLADASEEAVNELVAMGVKRQIIMMVTVKHQ